MIVQRARDNLCAVAFCNLVGGQDELVFDGHSLVVDHEGACSRAARSSPRVSWWRPSTCRRAVTARLRDARLRPPVRRALPEVAPPRPHRAPRAAPGARARRRGRAAARARGGGLRRARARHARLRREERLRARRARALGRDRLDARGADRGRRARRGPRDVRDDALALLLGGHARRRREAGREPRRASCSSCRSGRRWRPTTSCSPGRSRAASPTSPRRTSRPASAATC